MAFEVSNAVRTFVLAAGMIAAGFGAAHAGDINRSSLSGEAIEGFDVVAYWQDGQAVPGSRAFTVEWEGATWRFASAQHRDAFAADPARYAPAFGGYCARAMAQGVHADIHPYFFAIEEGRLYLFLSNEDRKAWLADLAHKRTDGEVAWASLTGVIR